MRSVQRHHPEIYTLPLFAWANLQRHRTRPLRRWTVDDQLCVEVLK
jgi:ribosomal protein L15E